MLLKYIINYFKGKRKKETETTQVVETPGFFDYTDYNKNKEDYESEGVYDEYYGYDDYDDYDEMPFGQQNKFYDEDLGAYYKIEELTQLSKRKTYIKGKLTAKYRGQFNPSFDENIGYYDVQMYQGEILLEPTSNCNCITDEHTECHGIHKGLKFKTKQQNLKKNIHYTLPEDFVLTTTRNEQFKIALSNPKVFDIEIDKKLHQTEDSDVYGTLYAVITGHLLDFSKEQVYVRAYDPLQIAPDQLNYTSFDGKHSIKEMTGTNSFMEYNTHGLTKLYDKSADNLYEEETAKESNNIFEKFTKKSPILENFGCGLILGLLAIAAFAFIIPKILLLFIFILIGYALYRFIHSFINLHFIFRWIFIAFFGFFILTILFTVISNITFPKYKFENKPDDSYVFDYDDPYDYTDRTSVNDKVKKKNQWQDYKGNWYSGTFELYASSYNESTTFKNALNLEKNITYDYVIHRLKQHDQHKLEAVYTMLEDIKKENNLNDIQFANMIIGFVQNYPYYLVLPDDCNPSLYKDAFIKEYLSEHNNCDPYQAFGINTPVEFFYNSKGDCDTRTVALYTILSYYKYDVIVLTSDIYAHSLIGLNLPYTAANKYNYKNTSYTLFETTVKKSSPGAISNQIANLNHWKISLKSK